MPNNNEPLARRHTDVPLREHLELQIRWLDRYFEGKIKEIGEATSKAEQQLSKRLEGMNEFRDTLKDQAATFATKTESDLKNAAMSDRVNKLELSKAHSDGRTVVVSAVVAFIASIVVAVIVNYVK